MTGPNHILGPTSLPPCIIEKTSTEGPFYPFYPFYPSILILNRQDDAPGTKIDVLGTTVSCFDIAYIKTNNPPDPRHKALQQSIGILAAIGRKRPETKPPEICGFRFYSFVSCSILHLDRRRKED
jgi:hypothetical protein